MERESPDCLRLVSYHWGVLLWNLAERREEFGLRYGGSRRAVAVDGLDVAQVDGIAPVKG